MTEKKPNQDLKNEVITFGCRLNAYESEVMADHSKNAGLENAAIFNTCAVTNEAVRQSKQAIRRYARENPDKPIIVTGCAAQIESDNFANMEEVDFVIGNGEKMEAAPWQKIADIKDGGNNHPRYGTERVQVNDIMALKETGGHFIKAFHNRVRAFVQIQNGCDHRCTFCIIPYGRGNSRSVPIPESIEQIRFLLEGGVKEIVLTGVDITSYGSDLPGTPSLGTLVKSILKQVPELQRLRLSSLDMIELDDELMELLQSEERLLPHMHLSLQHGDDLILKRMKRRHGRQHSIDFCQTLRKARPDILFGADIIAGFPTETEEMFQRSIDIVKECDLSFLHVFPFSPRQGTPAAKMPQLDKAIIKERARRLRDIGSEHLLLSENRFLGQRATALVETKGRAHTDNFLSVKVADTIEAGTLVTGTIFRNGENQLALKPQDRQE